MKRAREGTTEELLAEMPRRCSPGGEWRTELTLAEKIALRDKLAALAAREGISVAAAGEDMETPGQLMARLEPHRFAMRAHLAVIDEALLWLWNTPDSNLMVWSPPRAGKSTLVSRAFPFWWLAHAPGARITLGSYAASLALGHCRAVRTLVEQYGTQFALLPSKEEWAAADWTHVVRWWDAVARHRRRADRAWF